MASQKKNTGSDEQFIFAQSRAALKSAIERLRDIQDLEEYKTEAREIERICMRFTNALAILVKSEGSLQAAFGAPDTDIDLKLADARREIIDRLARLKA